MHSLLTSALLALSPLFALQEPSSTESSARLEALVERYKDAQRAFYERLRAAPSDEEQTKLFEESPDEPFLAEFQALAQETRGTETAAGAWIWSFRLATRSSAGDGAKQALESLLAEHLESPALAELAPELEYAGHVVGRDRCQQALRAMRERSPHPQVRAAATFHLATNLLDEARRPGERSAVGSGKDVAGAVQRPEPKAEARTLLEECAARFMEVEHPYGGRTYGKLAQGFLFELDHLQVGMLAPDFEATDADGVDFKLSDYRGKVVIVDFWGFW